MVASVARKVEHFIITAIKWLIVVFMLTAMVVSAFFLRLYYQPYSLDSHLSYINKLLKSNDFYLSLDSLELSYNNGLILKAGDVTLVNKQAGEIVRIDKLDLGISLYSLLYLEPVLESVKSEGLEAHISYKDNILSVGEYSLKSRDADKKQSTDSSIVNWLNGQGPNLFKHMKNATLVDGQITLDIKDNQRFEKAALSNIEIDFSQEILGDAHIQAKAILATADAIIPISMSGYHKQGKDNARIEIEVNKPSVHILQEFIPEALTEVISAPSELTLEMTLSENNTIKEPKFDIQLGAGSFSLPSVYNQPIEFEQARMKGMYNETDDILFVDTFHMRHTTGLTVNFSGQLKGMAKSEPIINIEGTASEGILEQYFKLLPDNMMGGAMPWLRYRMNEYEAILDNMSFRLVGPLKKMPFKVGDIGHVLEVKGDFSNLDFKAIDMLPVLTKSSGTLHMRNNSLHITMPEAHMLNQTFSNLDVMLTNMMTSNEPLQLVIESKLSGPAYEAVKIVTDHFGYELMDIEGQHVSDVAFNLDIGKNTSFADADFDIVSELKDISLLAPYINLPLRAPVAGLQVTDDKLRLAADGFLNGQSIDLVWSEDMRNFQNETEVLVRAELDDIRRNILSEYGIESSIAIPVDLKLNRIEDGVFEYIFKSNLTSTDLYISPLNWQNTIGQEASLEARGRIEEDGSALWIDYLSATGEELEVMGSAVLPIAEPDYQKLMLQLNPVKAGKTNLFIDYANGKLQLLGPTLDLRGYEKSDNSKSPNIWKELPALEIDIGLEEIIFPEGSLKQVNIDALRKDFKWQQATASASVSDNNKASLIFEPIADDTGEKNWQLSGQIANAGDLIKTIGVSNNLRNGSMDLKASISEQTKESQFVGEGNIRIYDSSFVKAPIIAQILAALSVTHLLDAQSGIVFDLIEIPFKLNKDILTLPNMRMTGPSIGMTVKGKVNLQSNELDLKGNLVPVEGLNRMIGNIPLIGQILTGSQGALLAADYTIRGTTSAPSIRANPLSIVTPGIIKDIFGSVFESKD